jgi:SAM-dependent methyltransferase
MTARHDPTGHRSAVGGMWDELGKLQFNFMVDQGLRAHHRLLDMGCGNLRGGVHFVRYLEPGHYVGVDSSAERLTEGKFELESAGLLEKQPLLVQRGDFDVAGLGFTYDFVLAQSVFTHLTLNSIMRCVAAIGAVLKPGGMFFATFFENLGPRLSREPTMIQAPGPSAGQQLVIFTTMDANPFHYDRDVFRWMCEGSQLTFRYIGDWGHPRSQKMLAFVKAG